MSTTTTNYSLIKPDLTDVADITAMNENWDKLDTEIKKNADTTGYLENKLTALADNIISGDNEVKAWAKDTFSNPNLFDNAYFLYPINTNGASTYTGAKDYIDKWENFSAVGSVDVTSNGLRFYDANGGTAYVRLNQIFSSDRVKLMSGKTVTVSLLVKGNYRFYIATDTSQANVYGYGSDTVSDFTVITKTIILPESEYFRFELGNSNAGECTIKWVKLELGSVATPFVSRGGNLERLQCQDVIPIANGGTGATSLLNFVAKKTVIDSSVNVDDMIENGVYQVAGTANMPTNAYGILLVMNYSNYAFQIYRSVTETGAYSVWVRSSSSAGTSWSDWHNMVTTYNLATKVQSLLTGGEVSVVKSVTRGTVTATSDGTTVSIAISNVNKTVVLLDTGTNGYSIPNGGGSYSVGDGAYVSSVTTTGFTVVSDVRINPDKNITVGYQVIQYY